MGLLKIFRKKPGMPDTETVAKRALCLGALIMRGEFEQVVQNVPPNIPKEVAIVIKEEHEKLNDNFKKNYIEKFLSNDLSKKERVSLSKSFGSWTQQEKIDAGWRDQSLIMLLWGLSLEEKIPRYDEELDQSSLIKNLNFNEPIQNFLNKVKIRPKEEIMKARDIAELWHWRARTTQLINIGSVKDYSEVIEAGLSLGDIVKLTSEKSFEVGDIPKPIQDDFPAFGKAYKDLSPEEYSIATSIAMERHFALNWLCGYSENWDETPTDT